MAKVIAKVDLRVPNTPKGLRFIDDLRKYANRDRWGEIAARPRGGERSRSGDCKRATAHYFGIYFRQSPAEIRRQFDSEASARSQYWELEKVMRRQRDHLAQKVEAAEDSLSAEITGAEVARDKAELDFVRRLTANGRDIQFWQRMTPLAFLLGIAASGFVAFLWQVQS
jgi:hypothetical protein